MPSVGHPLEQIRQTHPKSEELKKVSIRWERSLNDAPPPSCRIGKSTPARVRQHEVFLTLMAKPKPQCGHGTCRLVPKSCRRFSKMSAEIEPRKVNFQSNWCRNDAEQPPRDRISLSILDAGASLPGFVCAEASSAEFGPNLAEFGPNLIDDGRKVRICHQSVQVWSRSGNVVHTGKNADAPHVWKETRLKFGRPELGRLRSDVGRSRAELALFAEHCLESG